MRGPPEAERDMSLSTLLADFMAIIEHLWDDPKTAPALVVRETDV